MEKLKELSKKLKYTEKEMDEIIKFYDQMGYKPETLLSKVKRIYYFLISLGYSEKEVIKMTKTFPSIFSLSIENIKQKMKEIKELGYSEKEVIKMTKTFPVIFGYSIENIKQKIKEIKELGYSEKEVIKMTKTFPAIFGLSIENIKQKMKDIRELGYSEEEVIKMTKSLPTIFGYSIENMKQKMKDVKELGYSEEEVIKMTKSLPAIFSLSIENIKQKMKDIGELGYSEEEVIKMTKSLPQIFSLSIENIRQKIQFYNLIDLSSITIEDTKLLMQSTALSYARYRFYKDKGINIDKSNYMNLFVSQKRFEKRYGVTKEELLGKYDYKEYLKERERKDTQELGAETIKEQQDTELLDAIEGAERAEENINSDRENE